MNSKTEKFSASKPFKQFQKARNSLRKFVPFIFRIGKILTLGYSSRSMLVRKGYFKSVSERRPCRRDGSPLPWMNYDMIEFLERRLNKTMSVFEYGGGNSTLFFSERVGQVVAVETHLEWISQLKKMLPENAKIRHVPEGDEGYVDSIGAEGKRFDIIVIDADERDRCAINAPKYLSDQGVIIYDDSVLPDEQPGIRKLMDDGFKELSFNGIKPGSIRTHRTTILYREGNCFGI